MDNPDPEWTVNSVYVMVFFPGSAIMWEGASGTYSATFRYVTPGPGGIGIDQFALVSCSILLGVIFIWRRKLSRHEKVQI